MQIIVVQSEQPKLNNAVMAYLNNLEHEVAMLSADKVEDYLRRYGDGGGVLNPDVLVDLRVGNSSKDLCGPFYAKQPTGLVVHVRGISSRQSHHLCYRARPVLHCVLPTATWESNMAAMLLSYESRFCTPPRTNHDPHPFPL